jgi:hypothetical protein
MKKIFFLSVPVLLFQLFAGCQSGSSKDDKNESDTVVAIDSVNKPWAIITGNLCYPTDAGIPLDYKVAALNLQTGEITITDSVDLDFKKNTYQLKVKPGRYNVYSFLTSEPDQKAYYDEFVTCGLSANCSSHQYITVEVRSGETKTKIDPADWYVTN